MNGSVTTFTTTITQTFFAVMVSFFVIGPHRLAAVTLESEPPHTEIEAPPLNYVEKLNKAGNLLPTDDNAAPYYSNNGHALLSLVEQNNLEANTLKGIQSHLLDTVAQEGASSSIADKYMNLELLDKVCLETEDNNDASPTYNIQELYNTLSQVDQEFTMERCETIASTFTENKEQCQQMIHQIYSFYENMMSKTPHQMKLEHISFNLKKKEITNGQGFAQLFVQSGQLVHFCWYEYCVDKEAVMTVLAILRYYRTTGRYPANLEQLVVEQYLNHSRLIRIVIRRWCTG